MSFLKGYLKVHTFLQIYFLIPTTYTEVTHLFYKNPHLFGNSEKSGRNKIFWNFVQLYGLVYILLLAFFTLQLKLNGKLQDGLNMEQFGITILLIAMTSEVSVSMRTADENADQIAWVLTKLIEIQVSSPKIPGSRFKMPAIPEMLAYNMSLGFLAFPLFIASIPVFRTYEPCVFIISQTFGSTLPQIVIKYLAASILFPLTFYCGVIALISVLQLCSVAESLDILLPRTYLSSQAPGYFGKPFRKCYQFYSQLQIIVNQVNENVQIYFPYLICVGMILCIWGVYSGIMLGNVLPIFVYTSGIVITCVIYGLICTLGPVAAAPLEKSTSLFKNIWKRQLFSKMDRCRLRACRALFLEAGPFFRISKTTTLDLVIGSVNCSINLVILSK